MSSPRGVTIERCSCCRETGTDGPGDAVGSALDCVRATGSNRLCVERCGSLQTRSGTGGLRRKSRSHLLDLALRLAGGLRQQAPQVLVREMGNEDAQAGEMNGA